MRINIFYAYITNIKNLEEFIKVSEIIKTKFHIDWEDIEEEQQELKKENIFALSKCVSVFVDRCEDKFVLRWEKRKVHSSGKDIIDYNYFVENIEENAPKLKKNEWLISREFIARSPYPNKYYLEQLGEHLYGFLKNIPITPFTTLDTKNLRIYFTIGGHKRFFDIDDNISYYDFLTQVKRWLINFYPKYQVEKKEEVTLTEEESLELVGKGLSLDEVLATKKQIIKKEIGVITSISLLQDEFTFEKDGVKSIRIARTENNDMYLSKFLPEIRKITEDGEIKKFIFDNSTHMKDIEEKNDIRIIRYKDKMMMNFFIINFPSMEKKELERVDNFLYKWGNYSVLFNNTNVREDCIRYIKERQEEKGIIV